MNGRLDQRVAIITGASRGIGRAIASVFAREGATLALGALHEDRLQLACDEFRSSGARVMAFPGDVAEEGFPQRLVEQVLATHGRIDILVNCAGILTRTPTEQLTMAEWRRVIDVNLHGGFAFSQAVLPTMRRQGSGKILIMTSQMAWMPHPNASPSYEVSKAGLTALTRHLALHYAKHGIQVNAIAPGSIDTEMAATMTQEVRAKMKEAIPLKRLGLPAEVGELALFLASEDSNYITGTTMHINGGSCMQ